MQNLNNIDSTVGVVVVFYRPTKDSLVTFRNLADHGYQVVAYNNGIDAELLSEMSDISGFHLIGDGENIGLASALNHALSHLFSLGLVSGAVMFDQDSKPSVELPSQLEHLYQLIPMTDRVAAVGPMLRDVKAHASADASTDKISLITVEDSIATSGTYIPRTMFELIGPMRAELFIDCIDHEWCFRARSMGYVIGSSTNLVMTHNMGDEGLSWFGKYKPVHRTPSRHYYIIRNTLFLLSLDYVPLQWKFKEFAKTLRRMIFYILVSTARKETIRLMGFAVFHASVGRLGRAPTK